MRRSRGLTPWVEWLRAFTVILATASVLAQELGNNEDGGGTTGGPQTPQRANALSLFVYLATSLTAIISSISILLGLSVACQWPEPQCWCYNRLGSDKVGGRCCSIYYTNIGLAPLWLALGVLVALQREPVRAAMCLAYFSAHCVVVAYLRLKFQRLGFPMAYDDSGATVVPLRAGESELPLAFVSGGPMHLAAAAAAAAGGHPPPSAAWPRTQGGPGQPPHAQHMGRSGPPGRGPPTMVLGTPVYDLPLRYAVVGPLCGAGCECHRCGAVERWRQEQQAAEEVEALAQAAWEAARRRAGGRSCEAEAAGEAGEGAGPGTPGSAGAAGADRLWALREEDEVTAGGGGGGVASASPSVSVARRSVSLPLSEPLEQAAEGEEQQAGVAATAVAGSGSGAAGGATAAAGTGGDRGSAGPPGLRRRSSGSMRVAEQQHQQHQLQQLQRQLSPRTFSEYTFADAAAAGGGFGGRTWTGNVVPAAAAAAPSARAGALTSAEVLRRGGRPPAVGVPVPRALLLVEGVPLADLQQQRRSMRLGSGSRPGSAAPPPGREGAGAGGAGAGS
ncbi:hypothetical protein CHLRE_02g142100v5 [Chlamydomonas reinhardtii]|uniref:Uncharacterized protein n=1 Tax=Chlamydomonas reinhardtii TaxID=3055 RepID=A0A2K3E429_CHLRE|nr:uncharacterized protein CHLRE_02g142100v5 [Chlamydomonas reinhardtii]PNW87544.1 hypothetical protein CHLRE_02g142100v5 [Chlamydomonas reinhardtii]